jgi:hypothetical protein
VIWHFSVHKFVPLCQPVAKNDHLMTTNVLEDVTCYGCLDIVDGIAKRANVVRPGQAIHKRGETEHGSN